MGVPYNAATDVWSLGCVLYEVCTLSPAFSGSNMGAIVMKIMQARQPPIPSLYSRGLSDLIDAMLSKSAKWRPPLADILNFPLLKGDVPAPPARRRATKRRPEERRAESALKVVPLAVEAPVLVRRRPKPVRTSCARGRPPAPPRLKDGASVSKFLVVRPIGGWQQPQSPKVARAISDLERVAQFNPDDLSAIRDARRGARELREYLEATVGPAAVEGACRALRSDDASEEDALARVGGAGNERLVVLARRLVVAEDALAE
jgi:serine/threonine protein kinase